MAPRAAVRAPRQQRSHDTLVRILRETERALETQGFDDVRLQDIAARASVTVGAFYARFSGKEALLRHLENEVYRTLQADVLGAIAAAGGKPLRVLATGVFGTMARLYGEHRGVIRALAIRSQFDGALRRRRLAFNKRIVAAFVLAVRERRAEIRHPDPDAALRLAVTFVGATLREVLLFREFTSTDPSSGAVVPELVDAFLRYLRVTDASLS